LVGRFDLEFGPVSGELRKQLADEAVQYLLGQVRQLIDGMQPEGLLEEVLAANERIIAAGEQRRAMLPARAATYPAAVDRERLREQLARSAQAAVACRFLAEYVAAQPPGGNALWSLARYDRALALVAEMLNWAHLSDALHHGMSDVELLINSDGQLRLQALDRYELGPFAGRPGQVRCDHGLEFAAGAIREAAAAIGFELCFTPAYMPHRKGKIERFHRTIVTEFLTGLPFFTKGPRRADGTLLLAPNADPMLLSDFVTELDKWINDYNLRRAHRGLDGQTPLEQFAADATAIYYVEEAALRRFLLADEQRPVTEKGVAFFSGQYYAPELYELRGETVEVRYMPNDKRQIEIYHDGRWACSALPVQTMTEEDKARHVAQQQAAAKRARRHERNTRREARVRLAAMTKPGEPEDTSVVWAGADQLAAQRSKNADEADAELVRRLGLRASKSDHRRDTP